MERGREEMARLERRAERARREIEGKVSGEAHLGGPSGLASVLQSGRFTVTGRVYFNPLKAFDREPTIPTSSPDTLMSFEYIGPRGEDGFVYPDDASK